MLRAMNCAQTGSLSSSAFGTAAVALFLLSWSPAALRAQLEPPGSRVAEKALHSSALSIVNLARPIGSCLLPRPIRRARR